MALSINDQLLYMIKWFLPVIMIFSFISINAQNCSGIDGKKDKKTNITTYSGIVTTKEFYNLLIQKQIPAAGDPSSARYIFWLNAASKVLFTDSLLKTTGTMELKLQDGSSMTLDSVILYNNLPGPCCTLDFKVYLKEDQTRMIATNPIVTIKAMGLTTSFLPKRMKKQQDIANCLLTKQ